MICLTCRLPVKPDFEGNYLDEDGMAFGRDYGNGQRPHGMIYYHNHDTDNYIIRQAAIQRQFNVDGRPCEACGKPTREHEWMALDSQGFASYCSNSTERN